MKRYRALLLDADETIFDFKAAERNAMGEINDFLGITAPDAVESYSRVNAACWRDFELGLITQEEIKIRRFREYMELYSVTRASVSEASERYVEALSRQAIMLPYARETLNALRGKIKLALVTNGIARVQRGRLAISGIGEYFDEIIISQEMGFQKPDPRMATETIKRLGVAARDALFCGDSLSSDILTANRAGVDACWYNPGRAALKDGMRAEYIISDIRELTGIALGGGDGHDLL